MDPTATERIVAEVLDLIAKHSPEDAAALIATRMVINEYPWEHDSEPIALDEAYEAALQAASSANTALHEARRRVVKLDRLVRDLARQCDVFEAQLRKAAIVPERAQ